VLFIFFVLTLALHYLLPLLGTLYAETHPRKWIAYWIILLPLNYLLRPLLALVLGPTVAAFLHLVLGLVLLYLSSSEKVIRIALRQTSSWRAETSASPSLRSSTRPSRRR
jgi:hypothetical protein